jgi:hypothetical protein
MLRERLVTDLERIMPGFTEYLRSDANLFAGETPAAIFAACSYFVRELPIEPQRWQPLANLVNDAVAGPDASMAEAACSCFLENLAAPDHPLKAFLSGRALRYWQHWESVLP